ncbi:MAG: carbohydrate ABC transporter substrate-binding protein [Lachnospiraceae bacterium]|nr:carbohydrate ABC transporter substrate-binding protein [Lachnospiraceae bacterium]
MKRRAYLWIIILLSLISIFAAGCHSYKDSKQEIGEGAVMQEDGTDVQTGIKTAKGRYREEKVSFPRAIKSIFDVACKENGNVKVLFESEPGSFFFYESMDYGLSWEQKEMGKEWLPENYRVVSACFGAEGDIAVSAGKMSEDPLDEKHPVGEYSYFKIDDAEGDAKAEQLSLQLPEPTETNLESGYGLKQILLADDGKLYGMMTAAEGEQISFQIICFETDNGKVLWDLDTGAAEISLFKDKVYLNEYKGKIKTLDAKTGAQLGELSIPLGNNFLWCMDIDAKKDKIFYCNETGIYGTDSKEALSELLVDGKLSRFSDETYNVKGFFSVSESVFLVFVQAFPGAEMEVLRYEYDADLPTMPEHELVVYSLKENSVIEKIISDFQLAHPQVFVRYEVGMSDSSVKDETDAISSLNTEIMAGNGPDVLILNGLPWDSYQKKGMLENLRGGLDAYIEQDKVFENLFSAYQSDGSQYVIPISFKFPVLIGKEEAVSDVNSSEELLKTAEDTGDLPPFFRKNQALLRYMFSIYWQRIEKEGQISEQELKAVLEHVKQINDVLQRKENEVSQFFTGDEERDKNYDLFAKDNWLDVWNIKYGNVAMDLGYLSCLKDFADICSQNLSYQTISDGVFSALIAGINKESKKIEIAEKFLTFALSDEEQKIFMDGMYMVIMGFPVNKTAFENMVTQALQSETQEQGKGAVNLEENFVWPEHEDFEQLEKKIVSLDTPAMEDNIIMNTILENAVPYLSGEKEIDVTVNEIIQSIELYLLER